MTTTISLLPVALDWQVYAGDGFSCTFTFADKATGEPWPVGGTWVAHVRAPASDTNLLAEFTVTVDEAAGTVSIVLSGDQTRLIALRGGDTRWDLQQTDTRAEPRTWFGGRITAAQDVTRP